MNFYSLALHAGIIGVDLAKCFSFICKKVPETGAGRNSFLRESGKNWRVRESLCRCLRLCKCSFLGTVFAEGVTVMFIAMSAYCCSFIL